MIFRNFPARISSYDRSEQITIKTPNSDWKSKDAGYSMHVCEPTGRWGSHAISTGFQSIWGRFRALCPVWRIGFTPLSGRSSITRSKKVSIRCRECPPWRSEKPTHSRTPRQEDTSGKTSGPSGLNADYHIPYNFHWFPSRSSGTSGLFGMPRGSGTPRRTFPAMIFL